MKRLVYVILIVALSIPVGNVFGFVRSAAPSTGTPLRWFALPIQYSINEEGTPDIPGAAEFVAIDSCPSNNLVRPLDSYT